MAKRTFKTDLSTKGIEQLKRELLNYKDNILQQRVDLLAMRLAQKGVDIAQINVTLKDYEGVLESHTTSIRAIEEKLTWQELYESI